MKFALISCLLLFSPSLNAEVNLPQSKEFLKNEKLIRTYRVQGGEIRTLSTAKDFKSLQTEIKKLLGEGWVTEAPKDLGKNEEAKMKAMAYTKETLVIYVHPDDAKVKVALALTKLPGKVEGESTAILTIWRNFGK